MNITRLATLTVGLLTVAFALAKEPPKTFDPVKCISGANDAPCCYQSQSEAGGREKYCAAALKAKAAGNPAYQFAYDEGNYFNCECRPPIKVNFKPVFQNAESFRPEFLRGDEISELTQAVFQNTKELARLKYGDCPANMSPEEHDRRVRELEFQNQMATNALMGLAYMGPAKSPKGRVESLFWTAGPQGRPIPKGYNGRTLPLREVSAELIAPKGYSPARPDLAPEAFTQTYLGKTVKIGWAENSKVFTVFEGVLERFDGRFYHIRIPGSLEVRLVPAFDGATVRVATGTPSAKSAQAKPGTALAPAAKGAPAPKQNPESSYRGDAEPSYLTRRPRGPINEGNTTVYSPSQLAEKVGPMVTSGNGKQATHEVMNTYAPAEVVARYGGKEVLFYAPETELGGGSPKLTVRAYEGTLVGIRGDSFIIEKPNGDQVAVPIRDANNNPILGVGRK